MDKELEKEIAVVRNFFETRFLECNLQRYKAYCNGEEFYEDEFEAYVSVEWEELSPEFRYFEEVLDYSRYGDGIGCDIFKVQIQDISAVTYRLTTDGDNGWIVILGDSGELLAAGYTYIEVIEWEARSFLDAHSDDIDGLLSFDLSTMHGKTFWGKPLEEVERIVTERLKTLHL